MLTGEGMGLSNMSTIWYKKRAKTVFFAGKETQIEIYCFILKVYMMTNTFRGVLVCLCMFLCAIGCAGKKEVTFCGESTYGSWGSAEDSKIVARIIAREKLLEWMGHFVKGETVLRRYRVSPDQIAAIGAVCASTEIRQEVCFKEACHVRIAVTVDIGNIIRILDRLSSEHEGVISLAKVREHVRELLRTMQECERKILFRKTKDTRECESLIHSLRAVEWFEKGIFAMWVKNNTEEAVEALSYAIVLDPTLTEAYYYRGMLFLKKQDLLYALRDLGHVVTVAPHHTRAHSSRGKILVHLGRYQEAIAHFSTVIVLDPNDECAYFRRCIARVRTGEYYEALRDCDMALDLILLKECPSQVFSERGYHGTRDLTTERTERKIDRLDRE